MTRDQALNLVPDRPLLKALEALGLIKFDEPAKPPTPVEAIADVTILPNTLFERVWDECTRTRREVLGRGYAEQALSRLASAGYRVERNDPPDKMPDRNWIFQQRDGRLTEVIAHDHVVELMAENGFKITKA